MNTFSRIITAFILSLMIACGGGGSDDSSSGELSQNACDVIDFKDFAGLQTKIITGTTCSGVSSVVRLEIVETETTSLCTGVVIAPNKVLTAGHCVVRNLSAFPAQVRDDSVFVNGKRSRKVHVPESFYGDIDRLNSKFNSFQSGGQDTNDVLDEIFKGGLSDVAVVEFSQNLDLPTAEVVTDRELNNEEIISIFGYGLTNPDNKTSYSENVSGGKMQVDIVGNSNFGAIFRVEGSNTCFGDSGGPVFVEEPENGVIGVTSLGTNSCKVGELSIFTRLSAPGIRAFLNSVAPDAQYS